MPNVIDFFCGCGGFSLGAARAGFNIVGAIDNDSHAIAAHRKNFPNSKHLEYDLSQTSGTNIRKLLGLENVEIDGLIGGPPCQGFSSIGHRKSDDIRNRLFVKFYEFVSYFQPKFFLSENVPGILRSEYNSLRQEAISKIEKEYIFLKPMKLKASDYGAPTSRERVFFLGLRRDCAFSITEKDFLPDPGILPITVEDALKGLPEKIDANWQKEEQGWQKVGPSHNGYFGARLNGEIPENGGDKDTIEKLHFDRLVSGCLGTRHSKPIIQRFKKVKSGQSDMVSKSKRLDPKGFCPTLRAGTSSERGSYQAVRPIHPVENRVITPREAARLQGFPDWYQFDSTKWHSFRQIGNSVSPILAERIMNVLINELSNLKT